MADNKHSKDAFLGLEWGRRSIAEYVIELGNTQVFVESVCKRVKDDVSTIEQTEERLLKDYDHDWGNVHSLSSVPTSLSRSLSSSSRHSGAYLPRDQTHLPTMDDNIYICLYLAKLYADFARCLELETVLPNKSENVCGGKGALFKPLYRMAVDIGLCYIKIAHISYQSRFSKSTRLRMPRFDSSKCSDDDHQALAHLLHECIGPYEERYPVRQSSQGSVSASSVASSIDSVCSDPVNPNYMVPLYFKIYIHDHRDMYWKYMCPAARYLIAQEATHHPPSKLLHIAVQLILDDVINTFHPKRQEAKMHDYVLDDAQMRLDKPSELILKDVGKITMHYSQCPLKAVLLQCVYHIKNRLSLLNFKFRNQCYCDKPFHFYLMCFDE